MNTCPKCINEINLLLFFPLYTAIEALDIAFRYHLIVCCCLNKRTIIDNSILVCQMKWTETKLPTQYCVADQFSMTINFVILLLCNLNVGICIFITVNKLNKNYPVFFISIFRIGQIDLFLAFHWNSENSTNCPFYEVPSFTISWNKLRNFSKMKETWTSNVFIYLTLTLLVSWFIDSRTFFSTVCLFDLSIFHATTSC